MGPEYNYSCPCKRGAEGDWTQRRDDNVTTEARLEGCGTSQGMLAAPRSRKRQGTASALEPLEGVQGG